MKTRAKSREEKEAKKRQIKTIGGNNKNTFERNYCDDDSSSSFSPSTPTRRKKYVCVYCGMPCAALYRQLNKTSLSSIKAMHCERCQRIVDPYIEREWLLVIIDCALLRPEAYRHILYNNQDFSSYIHIEKDNICCQQYETGNRNPATTSGASTLRLIKWTLISSVFHAYLKWQTHLHTQQQLNAKCDEARSLSVFTITDSSTLIHATFVVTSVLDLLAQWLAVYGFMKLISMASASSSSKNNTNIPRNKDDDSNGGESVPEGRKLAPTPSISPSHSIAYQIYLGLLLPTSFQVVCVLVILWENSKTTLALGSLLVAYWQCLGISLISINSNSKLSTKTSLLMTCTPFVGILSLIVWRYGVNRFLLTFTENRNSTKFECSHVTIPCVGFEMDGFGDVVNAITDEDFGGGGGGWAFPSLPLCLT